MNVLLSNAILASYARYPNESLTWINQEKGYISFYRSKTTDTELYSYIPNSSNCIYFVFRGTEPHTFKDIFTDANAFTIPYNNLETKIKVHRGVYESYLSIRTFICKQLYNLSYKHNIYVIGHSLGAGLAALCAVDIQYNYFTDPVFGSLECFLYGGLKVFNKEGMISYNKRVPRTINVQNNRDPVILMPPFMGYKHVGEIYKIKSKRFIRNHDIVSGYIDYLEGDVDED